MLSWFDSPQAPYSRYLLLDRDGILNENRADYVKSMEEVKFYPDALEALGLLCSRKIGVILISNQSGINRGLISWQNFWRMHEGIIERVEQFGGSILAAYYCPHRPDEKCGCRKPSAAMLLAACRFAGIEPSQTSFIGDHETDMQAAAGAGCRGIRVCRGDQPHPTDTCTAGYPVHTSLLEVVVDLCHP